MKKILIALSIFIFLVGSSLAGNVVTVGLDGSVAGGGGSCNATPFYENTIADFNVLNVSQSADNVLRGGKWNGSSSLTNVCEVEFNLTASGDVDAYTWQIEHWSGGSSSDMGALSSTSDTTSGTSMPNDSESAWVTFVFSTPITVAQGDALVITRSDHSFDNSNYLITSYDYNSTDTDFFYRSSSGSNGTSYYTESTSHAINIKIHQTQ
jgi:hypothetical protein